MAPPKRKAGGRVTPKGTRPGQLPTAPAPVAAGDEAPRHASVASSRYTPPTPRIYKESPRWVPVLMFALLGIGVVVIILNYLGLLPSAPTNWYLLVGLAGILGGIVTATQFR
jgi:Cell division protein CrgA